MQNANISSKILVVGGFFGHRVTGCLLKKNTQKNSNKFEKKEKLEFSKNFNIYFLKPMTGNKKICMNFEKNVF